MRRILVVATGGTIASLSEGAGLVPALTGEELVARVPEVADLCNLDVVQPMNIDSTNMGPAGWLSVAKTIGRAYDSHDGFVILHGTDTLAYTSAALSYLVQGGEKPIVLTGSQQPMSAPFTDARLNLYQAVLFACDEASRGTSVVFGGRAICGTHARKQRTMSFNAFTSVNFPDLARLRGDRIVRTGLPSGADDGPLRLYDRLDERVIAVKLTPALPASALDALAGSCDAMILETFGIGGVPDSLRRSVLGWADSGRTVVMTTQVPEEGLDLGVYEVGRPYADHPGILRGGDMTTEALVAKTMWALGQTRDPDTIRELFYRPVNHDRQGGEP